MVLRGQKSKICYMWFWVKPSELERLSLLSLMLVLFKNILHHLKRKNSSCKRCHISGVLAHPCFSVDSLIYTLASLSWSKTSAFLQMINSTYLKCLEIICFKVRHSTCQKTESLLHWELLYKRDSHPRSVPPTGPNPLCTAALRIPDLVFGDTSRESWNWRKI